MKYLRKLAGNGEMWSCYVIEIIDDSTVNKLENKQLVRKYYYQ